MQNVIELILRLVAGDGQDGVAQVQNRAGNGSADTGQGVEEGMEAEVGSREEMIGEVNVKRRKNSLLITKGYRPTKSQTY